MEKVAHYDERLFPLVVRIGSWRSVVLTANHFGIGPLVPGSGQRAFYQKEGGTLPYVIRMGEGTESPEEVAAFASSLPALEDPWKEAMSFFS